MAVPIRRLEARPPGDVPTAEGRGQRPGPFPRPGPRDGRGRGTTTAGTAGTAGPGQALVKFKDEAEGKQETPAIAMILDIIFIYFHHVSICMSLVGIWEEHIFKCQVSCCFNNSKANCLSQLACLNLHLFPVR